MVEFNSTWLESVPEPPAIPNELAVAAEGLYRLVDDARVVDAWRWWAALSLNPPAELGELTAGVPRATRIGVGFSEQHEGQFGVIVTSESSRRGPTRSGQEPREPVQEELSSEAGTRDREDRTRMSISLAGSSLPVATREVHVEEHWCTSPPVNGPVRARTACRVRSTTRGYVGWLIPRHASNGPGTHVDVDGAVETVIDHFGVCIDAVVASDTSRPLIPAATAAAWPIAPGQVLHVTDSVGSQVATHALDLDLNFGLLRIAAFPVRVSIAWQGSPGQSGSLIVDDRDQPAGMYLGVCRPQTIVTGAGPVVGTPFGYAQVLYQLQDAANLEFIHA